MKIILSIIALCVLCISHSKADPVLYDSTHNVFTAKQVRKIDSLLKDADAAKLKYSLVQEQLKLSIEIEDSLKTQILILNAKNGLLDEKISFLYQNDSLVKDEASTYRKLYLDVNAALDREKDRSSKGTLWFAAGSISGVAVIYLCSLILNNVSH